MDRLEILPKILKTLYEMKQQDGWTDLARIGKPLNDQGINYKALGYWKLKDFLDEFSESIEFNIDNSHSTPVIYARQRMINNDQRNKNFISKIKCF